MAHCTYSLAGAGQQQHLGHLGSNKAPAAVLASLGVLPTQMGSLGKTKSGPQRVSSCPAYGPHMGRAGLWGAAAHELLARASSISGW